MRFALPPFRTLRTRLTVLYAGFFTAGLIALAILAQVMIERSARRSAEAELAASGSVYDRLWQERERSLTGAADVVARDFGFRSAVATHDSGTIASALDSLRSRAGVPRAVLVTSEGELVGDAGPLNGTIASLVERIVGERRDAVIAAGGKVYRIVTSPVMAPLEVGRIAFIVPLDRAGIRALERLSAIPLNAAVLIRDGRGHWTNGTVTIADALPVRAVRGVELPSGAAFAMLRPLEGPTGTPEAALLLSYPMVRAMAPFRAVQLGLVVAGMVWLVVIVIGSGRLARTIVKPIAALDAAARRLEEGERTEVRVERQDEVGRLALSFNRMSEGIKEREERITHLAFHDGLTDLPNRAFFQQTLEQAVARAERTGEQLGVLCLDLDGFKTINDTLGHPAGDALLRRIAVLLVEHGHGATVARLGGDEFAVLLTETEDCGRARRMAQDVASALSEPLDVDGQLVATGASIGISIFPTDAACAEVLVKNADLALYRAKQDGRGGYRFFEPSLDEAARRRRQIEADLRVALRTGQLALHFQPIVTSDGGVIRGFEALLRWRHPTEGFISPVEFIPVAEETGLIGTIGEWVLHEACRVAGRWPPHIRVAVNVSPLQFRAQGFGAVVLQALTRAGLPPERLEVEITESVFLAGEDSVVQTLHMLRRMGVRIALDDFGTGYSSLSYLRSFPFNKIKIDRSFVTNVADDATAAAIVKAIIDLASALNMETTAEGVEDAAQHTQLCRQGCSTLQGFLFSRPIDVDAVDDLLRSGEAAQRAA